jgi:hypothetical protein
MEKDFIHYLRVGISVIQDDIPNLGNVATGNRNETNPGVV